MSEQLTASSGECGCGHPGSQHTPECQEWRRYPEVLNARPCGCTSVWTRVIPPGSGDTTEAS